MMKYLSFTLLFGLSIISYAQYRKEETHLVEKHKYTMMSTNLAWAGWKRDSIYFDTLSKTTFYFDKDSLLIAKETTDIFDYNHNIIRYEYNDKHQLIREILLSSSTDAIDSNRKSRLYFYNDNGILSSMLENNVPSLRYGLTSITTYYEFDNYGRKALEKRIRENGYSTAIAYIYDTLNRVARCRYYRIKNNGKRKLFNTVFFDSAGQIVREKAKHHEEHQYRYYYNKDRSQEYKVDYYKNGWGNPWKSITTCKVIKLYPE